ncbi:MAG: hypothetical protein FJ249_01180 [Nitrospira sp.]|nr:hypothetical protein [Nitrospira sp.]
MNKSILQKQVSDVLGMVQRDNQELFCSATTEEEELEAEVAAEALNATWYLIEASPALYASLKSILPLAEMTLRRTQSRHVAEILRQAKDAVRLAERSI